MAGKCASRTIGVTEMEKALMKKFKSVSTVIEEPETRTDDNVKEILRQVLNELYSKNEN
jgi:hypothetical protein